MEDAWKQIVAEALAAGLNHSDGPVPGAKLRQLIAKSAQRHGLEYPPTEYPEESFGDFLKRFDSIVMIRRRKGKDLLVAPVDNPQLLVETPKDDTARIREDLFEAFTRIPRGVPPSEPWYRRTSDTVVWLRPDELFGPEQLVKIPTATLELELSDRRYFIGKAADVAEDVRQRLAEAMEIHSSLGAFSRLIKAHGLSQQWHYYRFKTIVQRIRTWCVEEAVAWRDEWIPSGDALAPAADEPVDKAQRYLLERLVASLTDEDLRRISIPLDIVLKIMKG